jgi:hypothetical protein
LRSSSCSYHPPAPLLRRQRHRPNHKSPMLALQGKTDEHESSVALVSEPRHLSRSAHAGSTCISKTASVTTLVIRSSAFWLTAPRYRASATRFPRSASRRDRGYRQVRVQCRAALAMFDRHEPCSKRRLTLSADKGYDTIDGVIRHVAPLPFTTPDLIDCEQQRLRFILHHVGQEPYARHKH